MWQDSALPQTLYVGHRGEAGYWMSFANGGVTVSTFRSTVLLWREAQRPHGRKDVCLIPTQAGHSRCL